MTSLGIVARHRLRPYASLAIVWQPIPIITRPSGKVRCKRTNMLDTTILTALSVTQGQ